MQVLDSSVFASIVVKDEYYDEAVSFIKKSLKQENATLELAFIETANVLWKHAYVFKRIPEDSFETLKSSIKPLINNAAQVYSSLDVLEKALDNSVKYGLPVYDSLYVTLALSKKCTLVSFDERLKNMLVERGLGSVLASDT
ncbi:MAG: type II toxin-antitoxin system VapC family toxin [Thermoproteota archaeon]